MDKIIKLLFTTPIDAGAATPSGKPEVFHFYTQWIIFCAAILLIWFYYWVEGRKRFFGSHALHKYIGDKLVNQFALVAFIGPFLMFGRLADSSLFSWRIWRYGWLAWIAVLVIYWAIYFIRRYPGERASYEKYRTQQRYMPQPRGRRRNARPAGVR